MDAQVRRLVELTVEEGFGHNVSYCHGDLAALEVLALAAEERGDDELAARTAAGFDRLFVDVLERYGERFDTRYAYSTSLMAGTTGIGWAILRQVGAATPPSVLWLE